MAASRHNMSMNDFEDKRLEDRKKDEELNTLESGQNLSRPGKKLLLGTVQFYEDILLSLHKALTVVYNQAGKHIEVWGNPDVLNLFGIKPDDLKGKILLDIFPEPIANEFNKHINQVFKTNSSILFRTDVQFPNGKFWLEVSLSPLTGNNEKVTAVVGYLRDITDTIKYEEGLKASEEKYKNLIELAHEGILTANLKGVITSVNLTFLEMSGYSEKDFTGKKISRIPIIQPKNLAQFNLILDSVLNEKVPEVFEFKWKTKDDSIMWCEIHTSLIRKSNKLIGFQINLNDITERKLIEKDLLKSKQAYKIIIENAQEAIFILQDNHIRFCNSRSLELINCSMDELLNTPFLDFVHPDDRETTEKILTERITGKTKQDRFIFSIIDTNGNIKWLENNAVVIEWDGIPAILSFATDITDHKIAEEKETKYLKSLEFLSEKAMEFVELKPEYNVFKFLGEKIQEITGESIILLISYDYNSNITKIEHAAGSGKLGENLLDIINNGPDKFNLKINHELIKNLSFGKLIKYNDGLFELGYNIFPKNTYSRFEKILDIGDIYLIGLTWENIVYGNVLIFLPKGQKLENPKAIETVVKLGSIALQRQKAEDALRSSEEKYRRIFESYQDVYYKTDIDGFITEISPSVQKVGGYSAEEIQGKLINDFYSDKSFGKSLEKTLLKEGLISDQDIKLLKKDGSIIDASLNARLLKDEKGNPIGAEGVIRDISIRKKAEKDFQKNEERFRTLFIESPDAIIVEDYDGKILDVNPAACKLHKMKKEELTGKNVIDLVPSSHRDLVAQEFPKWITGEIIDHRGFIKTSTGECIPVEIHASKIMYSEKKALLFIVRDITKIKEAEDKLKEAVEKAKEADMLKSVFLANMSHEIRTPMNAIIGFSEILSDHELTKKEREEFINYITQGSNTLMNLIEDIIDITKIEAGQIKVNFADCNVNNLMDELYATFMKMKNISGKQKLEFRLNKPIIKDGFAITTDPSRIRQILSNLLTNAIKYTEKGYIEFGFVLTNYNYINFYVKDTGIGIAKDKLDFIFERFGQVEDSEGTERKGTGLGLSISKKLTKLLGGTLTVESELGKGSTFDLNLPIRKDFKKETIKEKLPSHLPVDWGGKVILIAEDSILNYTYLEALFQKTNVKLLWAKDGKEAIEMCKENQDINLVLMDIKMPILNGLEAITEIKKFRKDLPIIVQTAYAMPEDREKSLAVGGDEHLTKPINANELFSAINKLMS
ncbi:MAG: PAS domain S-box protein [Bacteroidetes bacterium]|nr:PAS domain S-box protein [Bacteroidota bacterium]